MPRVPAVTPRKLIKVLKKNGFVLHRITGGHHIYIHPEKRLSVTVPVHRGRDLGRGITLSILKDAQIPIKEFVNNK